MRRGNKPQQAIYRPGSGPLRKTNPSDEIESDMRGVKIENESHKKMKKPEQSFYMARAVVQSREDSEKATQSLTNGNYENRSKKNSNRRRNDNDEEWRQARQGSEPRGPPNRERTRDTRSVDHRNFDKNHSKPPSGRRNSTIGISSDKKHAHKMALENLPPRFQKKLLESNQLNSQITDDWDGATLTFQANNYSHTHGYNQNPMYSTYPSRGRGRGRYTAERSTTPDVGGPPATPNTGRLSTPPTSNRNSRTQSPVGFRGYNGRNSPKFRESLEAQLSPISPESPKAPAALPSTPPPPPPPPPPPLPPKQQNTNSKIFDWSEEVELNDRLEAEALSDAPTRSSSVTSLVDIVDNSNKPVQQRSNSSRKSKRKSGGKRCKRRSGSSARDRSLDNQRRTFENFKVPPEPGRRHRRKSRDSSFDRHRESSFERRRHSSTCEPENWREENRQRQNSELNVIRRNIERDINPNTKKGGVLVLPPRAQPSHNNSYPKYPGDTPRTQKSLFDPNNPKKPIIIKKASSRVSVPGFSDNAETQPPQMYTTDQYGNIRPVWYDETSEGFQMCHCPNLIRDIKKADHDLQYITNQGLILVRWDMVDELRKFLKDSLKYLLCNDLKFCQNENVEQHLWKMLYHNIIEITRKEITKDPINKEKFKHFLLYIIDEGTKYFEELLDCLEETHKFKLSNFLGNNSMHNKGSGYVSLALISAQKICLFLGDLGRYREQVNETSNYGKCRQWYIKAHEINPKNGRPYNQLAVLAVYARRKLDAVYFYMRSLMSSNPVVSAKENLNSLFDENRKKYEQGERKRREERMERQRQHMKQKESEDSTNIPGALRHEIWIRPDGGRRIFYRTQSLQNDKDSEEEDLAVLSSVEVNKRFVISYLHVQGKLITRIGVESFQEAAMQMLKEFRALLQHSPVPLPCNRFLQLLALNMFAIETTQLKDPQAQYDQSGYRSELQERALVISLQMFNLILERCVSLLQEHLENGRNQFSTMPQDLHVLLPAVKIWCDWMLCHSPVWNPPPSTQDFRVGSPGDAWNRLATLMNLLERLDQTPASASTLLIDNRQDAYECVRLPEDSVLCGFTPLMVNQPVPNFAPPDLDMDLAQFSLRLKKLLFFGTVFLCGLEPPVLKLEIEDDFREYVSVVCTSNSRDSPPSPQELKKDILIEQRFSDDDCIEEEDIREFHNNDNNNDVETSIEIRDLLSRKIELERKHKRQELHMQRVKKILSQSVVTVHIEVRPKYLVPDTNCFIDHLDSITCITASHVYTLMVPIIVMSELEGLSKGGKSPLPSTRSTLDPQHIRKVAQAAKLALNFLKSKPQGVKCVTTKGAVLSSTTFTNEDDSDLDGTYKNDDKILATCLALSKIHNVQHQQQQQQQQHQQQQQQQNEGEPKKLFSEVVLLTDDRNLRVKALARDVPVRELTDFMNWASLG